MELQWVLEDVQGVHMQGSCHVFYFFCSGIVKVQCSVRSLALYHRSSRVSALPEQEIVKD